MSFPGLLDSSDRLTDAIYFGSRQGAASPVPSSRTITAGFGLTGGGDLSSNRTFAVNDLVNGFNVINHGADPTGVADNTAAYASAIAAMGARGGALIFPPGIYKGSIYLPNIAVSQDFGNYQIIGAGIAMTVLTPALADTPLITKLDRTGVIQGNTMGGFTIQSHTGGSTGPAIDLAGFRGSLVYDIGYLSNPIGDPGGGTFASLVHLSAGQMLCFNNRISRIHVDTQKGPTRVILFDNKNDAGVPQGLSRTANDHMIDNLFIVGNTDMAVAVDALRGVAVRLRDSFFELNSGCTYVTVGAGMRVEGNHFESGVTTDTLLYDFVADEGTSNDSYVGSNEFSDIAALNIPATCSGNRWVNNLYDVPLTITDSGDNNYFVNGGKTISGTLMTKHVGSYGDAPTVLATNLGTGGTCTLFAGSNDTDGIILLNFGTAVPDLSGIVTFTFAEPFTAFPSVMVCPAFGDQFWSVHTATALQVGAVSASEFHVIWANGSIPADNTRLQINYHVKGLPN